MAQINYIVKVQNASLKEINDALKNAGIEVVSVIQAYKEEPKEEAKVD